MRNLFLAVLFMTNVCFAQSEPQVAAPSAPTPEEDTFWNNVKNDFISPFVNPTGHKILYGGTALVGGLLLTREFTVDPLQEDTVKKKPMGGYSQYGNISGQTLPNILYFVGMEAYSFFADDPEAHEFAIVMFKSTLYSGIVTGVLKDVVREGRPHDKNDKTSFPSAHATRAFAFASTVNELHGSTWGIPAYALATAVAYSRMNDNRHYVHDVIAGAAIGASYGISIAQRYKNKKASQSEMAAIPTGDGLAIMYRYSF
jgi:membrane-associated phospholipid phosphatase